MSDAKWKNALWNLLDILPLRRITGRVALSAGLIGLAAQSSPAGMTDARVPVSPVLAPEAAVRKFKGRYVLKRVANALTVRFVGHGSHSSHGSHASHASHLSSSSPSPSTYQPPAPVPETVPVPSPQPDLPRSAAPRAVVRTPKPPKPAPILKNEFDSDMIGDRWREGVLATAPETYDSSVIANQGGGMLNIAPAPHRSGAHFNGYVSVPTFDLNACSMAVQIRRAAAGATTIFAAAIDAGNWWGFRIEGGQLAIESHTNNRVAARKIAYDPSLHRFLRLRTSNVAPVVVWETSSDGTNWNPEYVETESTRVSAVRIVLSAGTTRSAATEAASFDNVVVEGKQ
ncbi:MAG TPA: hypothetical protein VGQ65_13745 [Thermoanaerobaculia bacterium]|jgi:hypothetical protein|nr:hypothetical protein [Thermoanaerobaculia bacterium]